MEHVSRMMASLLRRPGSHRTLLLSPEAPLVLSNNFEAPDVEADLAWLPTEEATLINVTLPVMKPAQRRAAVAFAIEDQIAQPLDEVHVVLGPEISAGQWLVVVVSAQALQAHAIKCKSPTRLLPDVLALPMPTQGWAVWASQSRILVRQADGTGFAAQPGALQTFWEAAGQPAITLYGGTLPSEIPVTVHAQLAKTMDTNLASFSLLTGRYSLKGEGIPRSLRPLSVIFVLTIAAHFALQLTDVFALQQISDARENVLRDLLQLPAQGNVEVALTQALATQTPQAQAGLLPLLTDVFSATAPFAGSVSLQDLRYDDVNQVAVMTLDAPDLVTLQRVEAGLAEAGLRVSSGAATTGYGNAQAQITVQPRGL